MNALAFDPWAALKCKVEEATPPNPPNSPNRGDADGPSGRKLGELGALAGVASPECKTAISPAAIRTEGEVWAEAYKRDAVNWMLQAMGEAGAASGATESDEPLWPDPGTPERERLDRKNAAIAAGLLIGWERHRVKRQPE